MAEASRRRPSEGHLAPSLLGHNTFSREPGGDPVAAKLMLYRAQAPPRASEQFKREMQVIAWLKHPNIIRFIDSGHKEPRHSCRAANGE